MGGGILATPYLGRMAFAAPVELTMLAWYGHAEPDVVAEFEAENNVKFKPKYYTGGDNMLGLIAQSPPGTFDVILSDAEYVQQLNAAGYTEELDPKDYASTTSSPSSSSSRAIGRMASCSRCSPASAFSVSPTTPRR